MHDQLSRTVIAWTLVARPGEACVLWDLDERVGVDAPWGVRQPALRAVARGCCARPGRAAHGSTAPDRARVVALYRYPVKAMAGEALESAELGWAGLEGDRRHAFVQSEDRSDFRG